MFPGIAFLFISLTTSRILKFYTQTENNIQLISRWTSQLLSTSLCISIMLTLNWNSKQLKERIWRLCLILSVPEISLKCTLVGVCFKVYCSCIFLTVHGWFELYLPWNLYEIVTELWRTAGREYFNIRIYQSFIFRICTF